MEIGATYLFFLQKDDSAGGFTGVPFGRFLLDGEGKAQPVDHTWTYLAAVQALTGLTVDEAAAKIAAALAQVPTPTPAATTP